MKIELRKDNCVFTSRFKREFNKLEFNDQKNIRSKLNEIFKNPEKALIKKLTNYNLAKYRLRIGHFRLLFLEDRKKKKWVFAACKKRKDLY